MPEKSVLFWGAGATRKLGMPTTEDQEEMFKLYFFDEKGFLKKYGTNDEMGEKAQKLLDALKEGNNKYSLDMYSFDICGLKRYINNFFSECSFRMVDLYNLLDSQISAGQSFRIYDENNQTKTCSADDALRYRRAMLVLLQSVFTIYLKKSACNPEIEKYKLFFRKLAKIVLGEKMNQLSGFCRGDWDGLKGDDFIFSEIAYISLNWDFLFLWPMFIAHKELNDENSNYAVANGKNVKLKIFNDFAAYTASRPVEPESGKNKIWYPYNATVATHVNDPEHLYDRIVTLIRTYLPHGQTNWLECPVCGKLSMYLGDEWQLNSQTIAMRSPLLDKNPDYKCQHCGQNLTTADSSMLLQTPLKKKASYIEEIQRDMRLRLSVAEKIVFVGYSLPADDIEYRSVFVANNARQKKQIYVVLYKEKEPSKWLKANDPYISKMAGDKSDDTRKMIRRYAALFGEENVWVNLAGFPAAADSVIEKLTG